MGRGEAETERQWEGGMEERWRRDKWEKVTEDGEIKAKDQGSPGGSMVESACLCRRHGSDLWSAEKLSQCATTIEPVLYNPGAATREPTWSLCPRAHAPQQEKPQQWEACAPQLQPLLTTTRWKTGSNEDSAQLKNKNIIKLQINKVRLFVSLLFWQSSPNLISMPKKKLKIKINTIFQGLPCQSRG